MQPLQLVFIQGFLILRMRLDILGEPILELLKRIKKLRHDEMQQRPQFSHGVLNGRAREKQTIPGMETQQGLPPLGIYVFNSLRLVQNHVLPLYPVENLEIAHN